MLFFASLLGMAAVGAAAIVGFQTETDETDDTSEQDPNDRPEAAGRPDMLDLATDHDAAQDAGSILSGGLGPDEITGTEHSDQINGYDAQDTIRGAAGDDILHGAGADDMLSGGPGDDTLHGGDGADTLLGDEGADRMFGHNGSDSLNGGAGDDSLVGSAGDDHLAGSSGDDALHGDLGDDTLIGGLGEDTLFGGWGNDTVNGIADDPETETLEDIDGRDYLNGGGGADLILAGQQDIVDAGAGADTIALGDWIGTGREAEIIGFSPQEDSLLVFHDEPLGTEPSVTLEPDVENGNDRYLVLNGVRIALITDAADLTLDDISLLPRAAMPVFNDL